MAKTMTRANAHNMFDQVIEVPYAEAYYLCAMIGRKVGYNCGVYGWNWSAYDMGEGVGIVTGYRNLTGGEFSRIREFEQRANELAKDSVAYSDGSIDAKREALRAEFCEAVRNEFTGGGIVD